MKAFMTIEEASEVTKLSVETLKKHAEKETIPHIKLGRRLLFEEDTLEEWLNRCSIISEGDSEKENIAD